MYIKAAIAGSFDLIHPGYMNMFKVASLLCDELVVFLREENPSYKPKLILSLQDRIDILQGIKYISSIIPYRTEEDLAVLLDTNDINLRILGSDYINLPKEQITGFDICPIVYIDRSHGWSSTEFKKRIVESLNT